MAGHSHSVMSLLQGEITMSETFTIVRKGDTFQGIALEHSTTVSALKKMNHIYGNNTLFVGQKLRIKEDPPSSLLAEASRSNKNVLSTNMKKGSSGSINRKSIQKPLPPPSTNTSSIYDFITSSLWGVGLSKSTSMSTSTSNNSTTIAQPIDDGKNMKGSIPDIDTLSAGFRPRASSGVGMEDLDSGEVIVTMPLTKSGDFKKAQPQADEVVVEPFVKAKIRNEHIKNAVLQQDNNNNKTTFLSINGQKLIDTEFDAELVEVNDHYFLSKTEARGSSSGGGSGSGSASLSGARWLGTSPSSQTSGKCQEVLLYSLALESMKAFNDDTFPKPRPVTSAAPDSSATSSGAPSAATSAPTSTDFFGEVDLLGDVFSAPSSSAGASASTATASSGGGGLDLLTTGDDLKPAHGMVVTEETALEDLLVQLNVANFYN